MVLKPINKTNYQNTIMNKLRNDSVFSQLSPEQVETLEGWLFEENLGYKEALERVEKEFQVKGSLSGLRRFYRRLAMERSREDLVEMAELCTDALKTMKADGTLQAGLLTLGYKCAMELLVQSPGRVREFTALLRALTSAQALEMKRIDFQREEERIKKSVLDYERKEAEQREYERQNNERWRVTLERREATRKANLAAKAAAESSKLQEPGTRETANPKLQIVGEEVGQAGAGGETLSPEPDKTTLTQMDSVPEVAPNGPAGDFAKAGDGAETPPVAA
jgi:hypothetical protein